MVEIPQYKVVRIAQICGVGVLALALVYSLVVVVLELVLFKLHPDISVDKRFEEFDYPYIDITQRTVPYIHEWYRNMKLSDHLLPISKTPIEKDPAQCIAFWVDDLRLHLNETQPAMIEVALDNMNLRNVLSMRKILAEYLEDPQPLQPFFDQAEELLVDIHGLGEMACFMKDSWDWDLTQEDQLLYATYTAHTAVVIDVLTRAIIDNPFALTEVAELMKYDIRAKREEYVRHLYTDEHQIEFEIDKYEGLAASLSTYAKLISINMLDTSDSKNLAVNILEAAKVDAINGLNANAQSGIAVAALSFISSAVDDFSYLRRIGKPWVDAYTNWNLIFMLGNMPYHVCPSILLPVLVSRITEDDLAATWLAARIVSLALQLTVVPVAPPSELLEQLGEDKFNTLMNMVSKQRTDEETRKQRLEVVGQLGEINRRTMQLTSPSESTVEHMFYSLCGETCTVDSWKVSGSVPHDNMNNTQNQIYIGFLIFATTVMAGIGLEIFVWLRFLQNWNDETEYWWRAAQFVFPLMSITALGLAGHQIYLALPIYVISIYKFGYPETIMYLYLGMFGRGRSWSERSSDFLNGIGTLSHHAAGAFVISMLLVGQFPPNWLLFTGCMVPIMQHWFVLVKYWSDNLYIAIELSLEFWFEWLVISNLWVSYKLGWTMAVGSLVLLVSHWLFLLAGLLSLLSCSSLEGDENVHVQGTKAFRRPTAVQTGDPQHEQEIPNMIESGSDPSGTADSSGPFQSYAMRHRSRYQHTSETLSQFFREEDESLGMTPSSSLAILKGGTRD